MDDLRKKVVNDIRQWGSSASIKLLESSSELFTQPGIQGVIGYRMEGRCAVVFGDPVAAPEDKKRLALAFHEECGRLGLEVIYVTISHEFAQWASKKICKTLLEIGEELIIDPRVDMKQGSLGRVIRRKTNHAQAECVEVLELTKGDELTRQAVQEVSRQWLNIRSGAQIYYAPIDIFEEMELKRWFYARHQGKIVGTALLYYLDKSSGWVVHMLMTTPEAPCGTPEMLISSIGDVLQKEGCISLSCGVVQTEDIGEVLGLGRLGAWIARVVFKAAKKLFSLDGRRVFWKKFRPKSERTFLAFSRSYVGVKELLALKSTFNVSYIRKKAS